MQVSTIIREPSNILAVLDGKRQVTISKCISYPGWNTLEIFFII